MEAALARTRFEGKLHFFPSIESTNTYAMRQAEAGAPEGSVYFADEQTVGRGRGGHGWASAAGSGLYVSVVLRPRLAPADVLWLSLAAGLAAQEAVRRTVGLEADIRWPNDLLLGRRKFCGILTELNAEVTRVRHAVVGIGINVHQAEFPEELRELATSLRMETGREWPRQELLVGLLESLECEVAALTRSSDVRAAAASVRERMATRSTWIRGKRVRVDETANGGETFAGTTDGLDERGFLRVRTGDGVRTVLSGGVREA
ncbi:MAG TPA: biotin--[acetyl-CoA-carboxylase] ligase [Acidobacteriaceae bacterium]|jgi:BirA family biotin operon repressor/biotin-[acetyl-CoA-carboxylase] ligase|nr:biotin--[acetyl-CoA-carboxylase] ligase [Acidobacteriaceae bacterium]